MNRLEKTRRALSDVDGVDLADDLEKLVRAVPFLADGYDLFCAYCKGNIQYPGHTPDCVWAVAREKWLDDSIVNRATDSGASDE